MNQLFLDTLEEQYDRNKFKRFILEFFNKIDLAEKNITVESQFSKHIDSLFFLGQYEDQFKKKVHLLEVRLKTESKLEQARTMQRNLIAKYLKDHWIDGALVAFYTSNSTSWRLSLVKVDYKFDDKGKTKEELSPAKRYSFLVGKGEPTHTAQNQLLKIFEQTTQNPALGQIEEAFSVEKVTKEFFEEYRKLFEGLVAELKKNHTFINEATKNNINTDNFAKKLLGQIVFLYFLQKKGWLGVQKGKSWGEGDRNFLRNLFDKSIQESKNFFNNYLEKLFYDTLNNQRSNQVDKSYSEYFQSKIPFLNGGLFDPQYDWENSLMYLDNRIFEQMFEVFDRYNFTVREDEPLEKEVAVDPEMLGKVFENLIEENLRKGKGTYYTPREIVHYMCRESLINYLTSEVSSLKREFIVNLLEWDGGLVSFHNDEEEQVEAALSNIKIVDPACGSGAFLVGMLQEVVRTRLLLSALHNKDVKEYQIKKETIQNCIYGVDIDPGAIEIAKLRLWLSLVVDYDLEEIEPLPNLDYKLMVGNSLIEKLNLQASAKTNDPERNKLIDKLRELKDMYFNLSGSQEKKELRKQVNELILLIENYDNEKKKQSILDSILDRNRQVKLFDLGNEQQTLADIPSQIKQLDTLKDIKETDHFEWHLNFNEVFENGGFDVVIANPPYVRVQNLSYKEIDFYKTKYQSAYRRLDLSILFIELAHKIMKLGGYSVYITSSQFTKTEYGRKIREILSASLESIVYFGDNQVFESATNYISLFFFTNKALISDVKYTDTEKYVKDTIDLDEYIKRNKTVISRKSFSGESWILEHSNLSKLLHKIQEAKFKMLDEVADIEYGLVTGADSVLVFKKNALNLEKSKFVFPLLRPNNTDRYRLSTPNYYVIYPYQQEKNRTVPISEEVLRISAPDLYAYLLSNKKKLLLRKDSRKSVDDKNKYWYSLMRHSSLQKIKREKILTQALCKTNEFCLDRLGQFFTGGSIYSICSKTSELSNLALLGLLNSRLCEFFYQMVCPIRQNGYRFYAGTFLKTLPIPKFFLHKADDIQELVNKILAATETDTYMNDLQKQSEVRNYERQIDQLVYKLYGLTPEEIAIVEGGERNG